jgi:hypothetical protein
VKMLHQESPDLAREFEAPGSAQVAAQ